MLWKNSFLMKNLFELVFKLSHDIQKSTSFLFLFLDFFFKKKKSGQALSQHIKIFYLSHYKAHLECSLSPLMRALPLVQKFDPFLSFIHKWALPLVQRVWSISSKRFPLLILIGLLVSLPLSLGFRVSKLSQSMDGFNIFSIKPITYS